MISRIFTGRPYECCVFDDASDALAYLQRNAVVLVGSELRLPRIDGLELLRQVEKRRPDTIRVALAANADREALFDALGSGLVQRYVAKPCTEIELVSVVEQSVDLWELRCRYAQLSHELARRSMELQPGRYECGPQIVHALRLPLQSIGAAVLLANLRLREDDPLHSELQRYLEAILISAGELQKTIGEIASRVT